MKYHEIISVLHGKRLPLSNEKDLQRDLKPLLPYGTKSEYRLDNGSIVDFFLDGVGIEIKIKGNRKDIYRQCDRYCSFDEIKMLLVVTNRALGLPETIHGKRIIVINLGLAWL